MRSAPWLDTRARFVSSLPSAGKLLDCGTSDGSTLVHFSELRPDLQFFATDLAGKPEAYPKGTKFHRGDITKDPLPWPDASFNGVTCMHLVEHLDNLDNLMQETFRVLKPGASIYFETPRPLSLTQDSPKGRFVGNFTLNFCDDLTHVRIVTVGSLAQHARQSGFEIQGCGISRNLIIAAAWPFLALTSESFSRCASKVHWMGWSAYLVAIKPA